jgi:nucleoside-diphosphate-sugar epimerase
MNSYIVTGATGFIGGHLVENLLKSGNKVIAPLRVGSNDTLPFGVIRVDVEDFDSMVKAFRGSAGVFHLATLFRGNHSPSEIRQMVDSNVTTLAFVCEAACAAEVPSFVYTESATQHVGGVEYSPFTLYAATKQAGTDILRYYVRRGLRAACISLFDTIGPKDTRGKLLSLLERTAADESTLQMSPGAQLVDYLYVDDVVSGLKTAMDLIKSGDIESPYFARLSSSAPVPLKKFVEIVESAIGTKIRVDWGAREYREGEMFAPWTWPPILEGWSPVVSLETGIRLTLGK